MELYMVNPYVRFCAHQKYFNNTMYGGESFLMAYDSRMLYCLSGSGMIEVEGVMYEMKKDSLLIFKNALKYRYYHNEKKDMECISANFDYDYSYSKSHSSRILPDTPSNFDYKAVLNTPFVLDVIYLFDASKLKSEVLRLYAAYSDYEILSEELSSRMKLIITLAYRLYTQERTSIKSSTYDIVCQICKYIDENSEVISSGNTIGERFSYHSYYINRLIKKYHGITLHKYIMRAKIFRSIEYLTTTELSISEIAEKCGFYDSAHFSGNFKKITGYSPSKYRYI